MPPCLSNRILRYSEEADLGQKRRYITIISLTISPSFKMGVRGGGGEDSLLGTKFTCLTAELVSK